MKTPPSLFHHLFYFTALLERRVSLKSQNDNTINLKIEGVQQLNFLLSQIDPTLAMIIGHWRF